MGLESKNKPQFEAVIGLEVHAELQTVSKMFCSCRVVDSTVADPNIAVCPVCAGMPGVLPVVNRRAVELGLMVALALECQVNLTSLFARKNYFYPDLPKGYQISQYEQPLARHGRLSFLTPQGETSVRIRRVHLEEDTGKLTHTSIDGQAFSLVDLNRAGVPLLEIVTEPDLHTPQDVKAYAMSLRSLLRYLGVNSGDMQKGVMRIEPNISVRRMGSQELGTRTEIKNLNSFRALERAVAFEIERQSNLLERGELVRQETRGWDESRGATFTQRVKEGEEDYRYFPEPDLPPLVIEKDWLENIRNSLPELPRAKQNRFQTSYNLNVYDANLLIAEPAVADYFEQVLQDAPHANPKMVANWIGGDLFNLMNQSGETIDAIRITPRSLGRLLELVAGGEINQTIGKSVLSQMYSSGKTADEIVAESGYRQISDEEEMTRLVERVLEENPDQVAAYLAGKETVGRWLFGQVMRAAKGQANPQVLQKELDYQLQQRKGRSNGG